MSKQSLTMLGAPMEKTTLGFVNLGCSKNQVDAEIMLGSLKTKGFDLTADAEHCLLYTSDAADVYSV